MAIIAEHLNAISSYRTTEPAPSLRLQQLIDNGAVYVAQNLSPSQFATLQAIATLFFRPNAKNLAALVDAALATSTSKTPPIAPPPPLALNYQLGLDELDTIARTYAGYPFAELSPDLQDAILGLIATRDLTTRKARPRPLARRAPHHRRLRSLKLRVHGNNLIPGRRLKHLRTRLRQIDSTHLKVLHRRSPRIKPFRNDIDSQPRRIPELLHDRLRLFVPDHPRVQCRHLARSHHIDALDRLLSQLFPCYRSSSVRHRSSLRQHHRSWHVISIPGAYASIRPAH